MSTEVDRLVINIPTAFTKSDGTLTEDAEFFLDYLMRVLEANRRRTGGDIDLIDELNDAIKAQDSRRLADVLAIKKQLANLEMQINRPIPRARERQDIESNCFDSEFKRLNDRIKQLEMEMH